MNSKIINKKKFKYSIFYTILLNSLLLITFMSLPVQNVLAQKDLSTLQKKIKAGQRNKTEQSKQQKSLESKIANSEQETAKVSFKLQQTEVAISVEEKRLKNLKSETEQLKIDKEKQQKLLEQQLISAYMAGQNDLVKLLLNQEDLSKIIRAKSYYHYLNKARLESIEQLQATQFRIEKNKSEQADSLHNLKVMRNTQVKSKNELVSQRTKRTKALQKLKKDITYQSARLAQLGDAEIQLKKQLKKQKEASAKQALVAKEKAKAKEIKEIKKQSLLKIAKLKTQLKWPIRGKVLANFGSKRSDQVKWQGIAIAANEGEKVRAVATGKVLFAGYFKGYGMVIALDHNDDYITLYGYNQTLLQATGDIVYEGDAIALAGHSGGQDKNSLYFELSHKGKAQDPLKWLKPRRY
jgi:murein hydrolase activator